MSAKPNILLIMFDQLAPQSLPIHAHPLVRTPNMQALADAGTVFDNAYCNSPLCAPSRFSMMAGQYCSRIGAYDNAAEFPSEVPTFAHYLRAMGYRTGLSGKMHFVGPDQLHGYEERLTTDVYPGDFGWTPDWESSRRPFWFHNMQSVVEAGVYERTLELDYDEDVSYQAIRHIYDIARDDDPRPFMLTVSFIQPHDPYMVPQRYWDRYDHDAIDMPVVPQIPLDRCAEHSARLYHTCQMDRYKVEEEHIRNARHAYYGMISYLDDQVGALMNALDAAGRRDDTLVVMTGDHGDMLGEHGLWYKMTFLERSVRVPLIMSGPGIARGLRRDDNVSLVDLLPTLVEYGADGDAPAFAAPLDGHSVLPLTGSGSVDRDDVVVAEYLAEGTTEPAVMVKSGNHKYIECPGDKPQFYDLQEDAHEVVNLAGSEHYNDAERALAQRADLHWDARAVRADVIASQKRRFLVADALQQGKVTPWDYQPLQDATRQYNRNYGGEMYDTDRKARIPFREAPPPDFEDKYS